jgi:hypothetical protein
MMAKRVKVGIWKSKTQSRAAADSPWAMYSANGLGCQVFTDTTFPQFHKTPLDTLLTPVSFALGRID